MSALLVALGLAGTALLLWAIALSVPGLSWRAVREALDSFKRAEVE